MGIKKPAAYAGSCKVCQTDYKTNEEVCMQKNGETWLICKNEECFKGQGGILDAPKSGFGGKQFTTTKFSISEATKIYNIAEELTEIFVKKNNGITMEVRAQFLESMFKTLSGNFKP